MTLDTYQVLALLRIELERTEPDSDRLILLAEELRKSRARSRMAKAA